MSTEPAGEYIALVVRLQADAGGKWFIHVDGAAMPFVMPLPPLTLAVRLWRISETGMLRGIIRLHGDDHSAPIQSNAQLEELVRVWLFGGGT
jgi:hypothetical protein